MINKLKQFRHIATRYDRKASADLAFAKLATVRLWLRFYESTASSWAMSRQRYSVGVACNRPDAAQAD